MGVSFGTSILGMAGNLALGQTFDIYNGIIAADIDCKLLPDKYDINSKHLTLLPNPGDLYTAWVNGYADQPTFDWLARFHNIPNINDRANMFQSFGSKVWQILYNSKLPRLTFEQIFYAVQSGIITKERADKILKNYGFRNDQIDILTSINIAKFNPEIILNNYFRGTTTPFKTIQKLRRTLGCNENDAQEILDNASFIAPPADLLRFAVRGVYNPKEVQDFQLDSEYDEISAIKPWASAVGIGDATVKDSAGNEITRDILKDYWMAHWELMSPSQGYEALHRIRPERLHRFQQLVPGITAFDFNQLNTLLKAQDYVPTQRKWLAAISYRTLQVRDVRKMYQSGVIDDTELPEQLRDYGYVEEDVNLLVNQYQKDKKDKEDADDKKKRKEDYGKLASQIYLAYEDGAIGHDVAFVRLMVIYDNEEKVTADLQAIDIKVQRSRIKWLINMVKGEFFLGLYTGLEAYAELTQGGVNQLRANDYVIRWQRQLSRPRKVASISTVLDWYKRLLITFDDASSRLQKLGVSNGEVLLYLEASNQDIQKRLIQEDNKRARTEKQQIEESKRLLKELQSQHKSAKADLNFYSSIAKMKQWYLNDQITPEEIIERMQFFDIPMVDINRYLDEWKELKANG